MGREKVLSVNPKYKCPLCGRHAYKLRDLAMHLAMKKDNSHANWRREHGFPEDYKKMSEVYRMRKLIMNVIKMKEEKYLAHLHA